MREIQISSSRPPKTSSRPIIPKITHFSFQTIHNPTVNTAAPTMETCAGKSKPKCSPANPTRRITNHNIASPPFFPMLSTLSPTAPARNYHMQASLPPLPWELVRHRSDIYIPLSQDYLSRLDYHKFPHSQKISDSLPLPYRIKGVQVKWLWYNYSTKSQ